MILSDTQLVAVEERKRPMKDARGTTAPELPAAQVRADAPDVIDLHGLTAAEAVAALDAFLNEALLASLAEVRVIHGRSGGRLKAAVHQRLRELPSIRGFALDPRNRGITIVSL